MHSPLFSSSLPASGVTLGIADRRWENWVEQGRAHDLQMRERWLRLATIAGVGIVLTDAVAVGLGLR